MVRVGRMTGRDWLVVALAALWVLTALSGRGSAGLAYGPALLFLWVRYGRCWHEWAAGGPGPVWLA